MSFSPPSGWLHSLAAPLSAKFGSNLTVRRSGDMVCWSYDGQSAMVELSGDGSLRATYIDVERIDAVSSKPVAAVYRSGWTAYTLTETGCRRMVADLADFFSGVREPVFTFVDTFAR